MSDLAEGSSVNDPWQDWGSNEQEGGPLNHRVDFIYKCNVLNDLVAIIGVTNQVANCKVSQPGDFSQLVGDYSSDRRRNKSSEGQL